MGKERRAIEKIGNRSKGAYRKQEGDSQHHGPTWFVVQSLIFSSGGSSGVVLPLTTTTVTNLPMAVQTYL